MIARSVEQIAAAVRGTLRGAEPSTSVIARGVAIDSRRVRPGDLFVALAGERVDGRGFVADAIEHGAVAAMVAGVPATADPQAQSGAVMIEVDDPQRALMDLARTERSSLEGQLAVVVGITGSTGKTCTKDFTAAVLGAEMPVVASEASFNNEVGLPLTILQADDRTRALVCEMGARGTGHLRLLCEVARPSLGVVTNVGVAHLEMFGSVEALREAKAELIEALPASGTAVLNADDPVVRGYSERTAARSVLYGTAREAAVRAEELSIDPGAGTASFKLVTPAGSAPVTLPVPGEHMVANALAAAAVGWAGGMAPAATAQALHHAVLSGGRMEVRQGPGGLRVINDAYNANPTSMAAALRAARSMAGTGRCIAVLGPMAELGPIAAEEHERVGELLARLRVDVLVTVGVDARAIAFSAEREGVEAESIVRCDDVVQAVEAVRALAGPGDLVLVKASRVARLERVAEALADELDGARA
jgi:UDP-N-acetylmuramoyl-tripeptide--D-alanyl-D-alanine ligase